MNSVLVMIGILFAFPVQEDATPRLVMTDGQPFQAEIERIEGAVVEILEQGVAKTLEVASIQAIQFAGKPSTISNSLKIGLVDGSMVAAIELVIDEKAIAQIVESKQSRLTVNRRDIESILLNPVSGQLLEQWQQWLQSETRNSDWLVFEREGSLDYVEGTVGVISDESITFTTNERSAQADRQRVSGVAFFHSVGRDFPAPLAILTTTAGSRLLLHSLRRGDPQLQEDPMALVVTTICGAVFTLSSNDIVEIDFAEMRFQYLSLMEPSTVEWNPILVNEAIYEYQAVLNRPRFDKSFSNQPLTLGFAEPGTRGDPAEQVEYAHGIAIKGGTRMVFKLDSRYSSLQGLLGFSPDAPQDGMVEIALLGDGKDLFRQVLDNRTDPPQNIDVNIQGVSRLTIMVDYQDGRSIGDVIHFCDIKVSR